MLDAWNYRMAKGCAIANQEAGARYHVRMVKAREAGLMDRAELAMDRAEWHYKQARYNLALMDRYAGRGC